MSEQIETVIAEEAPIGALLWPSEARFSRHYTLARVSVHRDGERSWVEWTYQAGNSQLFRLGQEVAVKIAAN